MSKYLAQPDLNESPCGIMPCPLHVESSNLGVGHLSAIRRVCGILCGNPEVLCVTFLHMDIPGFFSSAIASISQRHARLNDLIATVTPLLWASSVPAM